MDNPISFYKMFLQILEIVKLRSKDPRTKVAAAAVSPDYRKIHLGWNSMPSKINETFERWNDREIKHSLVIHAEESCILNAHEDLHGWILFLTMPPCPSCCRIIIHSGIKKIIYSGEHIGNTKYDYSKSAKMLNEAGVSLEKFIE